MEYPIKRGSVYQIQFSTENRLRGVDITVSSFDSSTPVKFDTLGRPSHGGTVTLALGGQQMVVMLDALTGGGGEQLEEERGVRRQVDVVGPGILVFLLVLVFVFVVIVAGLITCCIGWLILVIPFIGTVATLPFWYLLRAFGLEFLAQFGPDYNVFPAPEAPAAPSPAAPVAPAAT